MTNNFPDSGGFSPQNLPPQPSYGQYQPPAAPQAPQYVQQNMGNPQVQVEPQYELFAILSAVSIIFLNFFGIVPVILGHIALNRLKTNGKRGKWLAMTGLIVGYIGVAIMCIMFILFIGFSVTDTAAEFSTK